MARYVQALEHRPGVEGCDCSLTSISNVLGILHEDSKSYTHGCDGRELFSCIEEVVG